MFSYFKIILKIVLNSLYHHHNNKKIYSYPNKNIKRPSLKDLSKSPQDMRGKC